MAIDGAVVQKKIPPRSVAPDQGSASEHFPSTRTEVLAAAAAGDFREFAARYLRPCWKEVLFACRRRGLYIDSADDVFQELMVRLMQSGRFAAASGRRSDLETQRGNIPDRYLRARGTAIGSAKFRTYLKGVIANVVLETLRRQRKGHQPPVDLELLVPAIEDSLTLSLDRRWWEDAVGLAAERLATDSRTATTKGTKRLFEVLRLTIVERLPADAIATRFEIDRTGVSRLLASARRQFILHLSALTAIKSEAELGRRLTATPDVLTAALVRAGRGAAAAAQAVGSVAGRRSATAKPVRRRGTT